MGCVPVSYLSFTFFAQNFSVGKKRKKKSSVYSSRKKILLAAAGTLVIALLIIAYIFYLKIYTPVVSVNANDPYLYVPTGSNYDSVLNSLQKNHTVSSVKNFDWVAKRMNLQNNIHAGKYRLSSSMSNYDLAALLRSGKQEPVKLVLNKFRLKEDFSGFISHKLEIDSLTLLNSLNDSDYLKKFSLTTNEAMALFIPNTYEFFWNTSTDQFMNRMQREYDRFWTDERKSKAQQINLTPVEVITLASIIEEETNYDAEKSRIAGVYLNRLNAGMNLEADPTVKFALKNFTLKRILDIHLNFNSPYNTYMHQGLPPGPICTPSVASIDAVLNAERNDYYYFCADPDKPGTHVFAKDYAHHLLNAKRYQQWLNQQTQ